MKDSACRGEGWGPHPGVWQPVSLSVKLECRCKHFLSNSVCPCLCCVYVCSGASNAQCQPVPALVDAYWQPKLDVSCSQQQQGFANIKHSCCHKLSLLLSLLLHCAQVNASVDVYAFGIMMWELFVGQWPYGNMS
eukprot:GHUV01030851.1.p1 GENE.GHUV01030851.1~~GHUV01030851.1.p1  ORF type:complete len:135 (-),score=23.33 GHUV01030851.1:1081-1485(-)